MQLLQQIQQLQTLWTALLGAVHQLQQQRQRKQAHKQPSPGVELEEPAEVQQLPPPHRSCAELCIGLRDPVLGTAERQLVGVAYACALANTAAAAFALCHAVSHAWDARVREDIQRPVREDGSMLADHHEAQRRGKAYNARRRTEWRTEIFQRQRLRLGIDHAALTMFRTTGRSREPWFEEHLDQRLL